MKTAILGSGNVATHLSKALIKAGHPVMQVWSRNHQHAIDLALEIGANSIPEIKDISEKIEMVVISVTDDAIEEVAAQIPETDERLIIHTSGSTKIEPLQKYATQYGVLYPLQTFSKNADLDFSQIPLFVEAVNVVTEEKMMAVASGLSSKVFRINSYKRSLLHASAVFACNFTNHFYAIAEKLLESAELDFDLLRPLIQETSDKVMLNSPFEVQTGPARRGDELTMQKHLHLLRDKPELQNLYQTISQDIVKMYASNRAGQE